MAITEEEVRHVARLSKLEFQPEETSQFTKELSDIIDMVEQLEKVDTTDVPVTTHGYALKNIMREDVAEEGTDRELLFKNVKTAEDGMIQVPAILDGEEEGA
ncbi:Asp-tRNA(Asn)/Glu-tRNA(Gln) amidotransferase subunit GatC [Jeotgalibaca ciconiae]|uniref:Aspartyl/glutamyl-tRNA(Asn/Gln) amidotransferase subunit C n=1 Tax=Jeotgalibaca ciconiae TaxID=2496265 RepID=A0A3Q9BLD5_9LACT|nr:Asp-tRNA(Asn)/Glu-tRNA(Gln) amidotransferase subunit GatC [Jeotgalibaca ciconiae]AZP04642.1 Asp-tRNA(Asn)/Glu-tRNA(Gln) amidotransferase subunit GatC [Jeotgalibaca ciconiae]HJB24207.1 Asp-tRNA(Asn)/Glu-tRNA(Gln) amidotransferase subunit GatC [Candidatus Jeotgalibaca pullicola]